MDKLLSWEEINSRLLKAKALIEDRERERPRGNGGRREIDKQ